MDYEELESLKKSLRIEDNEESEKHQVDLDNKELLSMIDNNNDPNIKYAPYDKKDTLSVHTKGSKSTCKTYGS